MIRILARPVCVEVSCDQNEIGSATTTTAITEAEILPGGVGRLAGWQLCGEAGHVNGHGSAGRANPSLS